MTHSSILHILYPGITGLGTYVIDFIERDTKRAFTHYVLFYGNTPPAPQYVQRLDAMGIEHTAIFKRTTFSLVAYLHAVAAMKHHRVIALHMGSLFPPFSLAKLLNNRSARYVFFAHSPFGTLSRLEAIATRLLARYCDKTIYFYPDQIAEYLGQARAQHTRNTRALVIPKVPAQEYLLAAKHTDIKPDMPHLTVGMIGRLSKTKDHHTLLRAFQQYQNTHPNTELHIIGSGPEEIRLRAEAQAIGIARKVHFHGMLSANEIIPLLDRIDIYVHATFGETFCYAIMEAQARTIAVVASDAPGVRGQIQNDVNGLLVPVGDSNALAQTLSALTVNPIMRTRLAFGGKASVDNLISECQNPAQRLKVELEHL